jgi:hypothetical protein
MTELQASRTLVKSPPELWAECSDAVSLARHLDGFGEIRITRLEPETAVAWEGERARGTVRIEPAGWGTKVILTAVADETVAVVEEEPVLVEPPAQAPPEPTEPEPTMAEAPPEPMEPEPTMAEALSEPEPPPPVRKRRFARLRAFWRGEPLAGLEPAVESVPAEEPPVTITVDEPPVREPSPPVAEASPPVPEPPPPAAEQPAPAASGTEAALAAALDSLGQAHHRPYSRA